MDKSIELKENKLVTEIHGDDIGLILLSFSFILKETNKRYQMVDSENELKEVFYGFIKNIEGLNMTRAMELFNEDDLLSFESKNNLKKMIDSFLDTIDSATWTDYGFEYFLFVTSKENFVLGVETRGELIEWDSSRKIISSEKNIPEKEKKASSEVFVSGEMADEMMARINQSSNEVVESIKNKWFEYTVHNNEYNNPLTLKQWHEFNQIVKGASVIQLLLGGENNVNVDNQDNLSDILSNSDNATQMILTSYLMNVSIYHVKKDHAIPYLKELMSLLSYSDWNNKENKEPNKLYETLSEILEKKRK